MTWRLHSSAFCDGWLTCGQWLDGKFFKALIYLKRQLRVSGSREQARGRFDQGSESRVESQPYPGHPLEGAPGQLPHVPDFGFPGALGQGGPDLGQPSLPQFQHTFLVGCVIMPGHRPQGRGGPRGQVRCRCRGQPPGGSRRPWNGPPGSTGSVAQWQKVGSEFQSLKLKDGPTAWTGRPWRSKDWHVGGPWGN